MQYSVHNQMNHESKECLYSEQKHFCLCNVVEYRYKRSLLEIFFFLVPKYIIPIKKQGKPNFSYKVVNNNKNHITQLKTPAETMTSVYKYIWGEKLVTFYTLKLQNTSVYLTTFGISFFLFLSLFSLYFKLFGFIPIGAS